MDWGTILQIGGNIYGQYEANKQRDEYYDMISQAESQRYQQSQEQYAYESAIAELMASSKGGGGGGGGGRPRITQGMLDEYKANMKTAFDKLTPFSDAGIALLPGAKEATQQGITGVSNLMSFYNTPEGQKKFNQSAPAYNTKFSNLR